MKKSLLGILACPIDKHYPLELYQFNYEITGGNKEQEQGQESVQENLPDETIITDGILYCTECSRYYPIIDQIPIMLPDELRQKQKDTEFLQKWQKKIPDKVLKEGKPWHL